MADLLAPARLLAGAVFNLLRANDYYAQLKVALAEADRLAAVNLQLGQGKAQSDQALAACTTAREQAEADRDAARAQLATCTSARQQAEVDRDTARAERDTARQERDAVQASLTACQADRSTAQAQLASCTSARSAAEADRDSARAERDAARAERDEATGQAESAAATASAAMASRDAARASMRRWRAAANDAQQLRPTVLRAVAEMAWQTGGRGLGPPVRSLRQLRDYVQRSATAETVDAG